MTEVLVQGLINGDRQALARCITLAESTKPEDHALFQDILNKTLPSTGKSIRIGITGAPGVGKSSFIESFGLLLTGLQKKVAVLSIDPSSPLNKGSILGDKTRMEKLSKDALAFIRPSPSRSFMGGVTHATRESILLCEAAGYEIILVETVGVGQSEVAIKDMTDCFLLLMLAGSGDELQGIKKGIMEMADMVAITKADGDNLKRAQLAASEFQHALHLIKSDDSGWAPKVITTSALEQKGLNECWILIESFIEQSKSSGRFINERKKQKAHWLNEQLNFQLRRQMVNSMAFGEKWEETVKLVEENKWTVFEGIKFLMA